MKKIIHIPASIRSAKLCDRCLAEDSIETETKISCPICGKDLCRSHAIGVDWRDDEPQYHVCQDDLACYEAIYEMLGRVNAFLAQQEDFHSLMEKEFANYQARKETQ